MQQLNFCFSWQYFQQIRKKQGDNIFFLESLDHANLDNERRSCIQKHQKLKVFALKEDQKRKVFLYFYTL